MVFYAHSLPQCPVNRWHRLEKHLLDTAEKAKQFAEPWGAGEWAWNAAWSHDFGKSSQALQQMLHNGAAAHDRSRQGWTSGWLFPYK